MTFGARLRAERERLNLSQEEAAALFCGLDGRELLSLGTWRGWECDRRTPPELVQYLVLKYLASARPRKTGSFNARGRPSVKD